MRRAPPQPFPSCLVVAAADRTERFAKASGPGGQAVNTTDSKVQLSIDIATCASLSDAVFLREVTADDIFDVALPLAEEAPAS